MIHSEKTGDNAGAASSFPNSKKTSENRMSTVAMIPARYAATRFPAKLMQPPGK
jgi:hypothetical protein